MLISFELTFLNPATMNEHQQSIDGLKYHVLVLECWGGVRYVCMLTLLLCKV